MESAQSPATPLDQELSLRLAALHRIADAAVPITTRYFRAEIKVDNKFAASGGFDPVTIADREAELALRAAILAEFPDDGIEGEEHASHAGTSGYSWLLDPIDGTRAYISGLPLWGTLIAVRDATEVRLGLLDQPHLRERFVGSPLGAHLNGRPLRVRACSSLANATLSTTGTGFFEPEEFKAFTEVENRVQLSRHGYDCYAYAMLAHGFLDLVVEAGLKPCDVQALIPIIRAAGGMITSWQGGDPREGGRVIAAGDPRIHAEALAFLKLCP